MEVEVEVEVGKNMRYESGQKGNYYVRSSTSLLLGPPQALHQLCAGKKKLLWGGG